MATGVTFTKTLVLRAYASGFFPMGDGVASPGIDWYNPIRRGILPLDRVHLPRRLLKTVRSGRFDIRVDADFDAVIAGCADPNRDGTWINPDIRRVYRDLFDDGHVHTVETYVNGALVGGLYGVALKSAFMGESMFTRVTDASKVALVHLLALLKSGGYTLLDTQMVTGHMEQFGAIEISRTAYLSLLGQALSRDATWRTSPLDAPAAAQIAAG